jgi:tetratricopeptide (TPR) repeat protein
MKLSVAGFCTLLLVGCASPGARTIASPEPSASPAATVRDDAAPSIAAHATNPALERALALYAARDYRAAAEAFQAAYRTEDSPSLVLAQAQALRLAGDCPAALPLYERFLESQSDPTYTNAVRPMMESCLDRQQAADSAVARSK